MELLDTPENSIPCCKNCELNPSKFICLHCDTDNCYLCLGCSLFHSKVRAFRNHSIRQIEASRDINPIEDDLSIDISDLSTIEDVLQFLQQLVHRNFNKVVENITERSYNDFTFWQSVAFVFIASIMYFVITKVVLGSLSMLFNVLLAFVVFGRYRNIFNENASALYKLKHEHQSNSSAYSNIAKEKRDPKRSLSSMISGSSTLEHEEFPGEFNYKLQSKPAALRTRGNVYKRRQRQEQNEMNNDISMETASSIDE